MSNANTYKPICWRKYIDATMDRPPRDLFLTSLECLDEFGDALDLGAGAHMDAREMLHRGFASVTAIDADPAAEEVGKTVEEENFTFIRSKLEDFDFPEGHFNLVNAQRVFPYVSNKNFERVLRGAFHSLKDGGVIACQLFGEQDETLMPDAEPVVKHTKDEALNLFKDLTILYFNEKHEDKESARGTFKHFHEFEIIARKRA